MGNKDSFGRTLIFVLITCLVCSVIVAGAAVGLRPMQLENKALDKQTRILEASGLLESSMTKVEIVATYTKYVEAKLLDFTTGDFVEGNPETFDQRIYALNKANSITPSDDVAKINRRSNRTIVYLVKDDSGKTDTVILEVRGSGLWSMMYAFVGLETDLNTVKSVIYYDQGETPGLGAEISTESFQLNFIGKEIYSGQELLSIKVTKYGLADKNNLHENDYSTINSSN